MAVHIFWDNSNIWIGLQKLCDRMEKVPPMALRVYLKNLDDYVLRGRKAGTKAIAGSYPPECVDVIENATALGYDTKFLHRITDGSIIREQGVDANLQLHMSLALNRGRKHEVMAVLTGDSNVDPDSRTSFIDIIELALEKEWSVEVYAIEGTLSQQKYAGLKDRFGANLQIDYIDKVYYSITYLKEGDYYYKEDPTEIIHVPNRIVASKSW